MGYIWEMCGKCAGYVWYVIRHLRCNWDTLCDICYRKLRMLMLDVLDKLYLAVQELVTSSSESTALTEKSGTSHGSSSCSSNFFWSVLIFKQLLPSFSDRIFQLYHVHLSPIAPINSSHIPSFSDELVATYPGIIPVMVQ